MRARPNGFVVLTGTETSTGADHELVFIDGASEESARVPISDYSSQAVSPGALGHSGRVLFSATDRGAIVFTRSEAGELQLDHISEEGELLSRAVSNISLDPTDQDVYAIESLDATTAAIFTSDGPVSFGFGIAAVTVIVIDIESGAEQTRFALEPSFARVNDIHVTRALDGRVLAFLTGGVD